MESKKVKILNSEQKTRIKKFMTESKGIVLTGYAKTDVDVSLMKEVMDDAGSLLLEIPGIKRDKRKPFTLKVVQWNG